MVARHSPVDNFTAYSDGYRAYSDKVPGQSDKYRVLSTACKHQAIRTNTGFRHPGSSFRQSGHNSDIDNPMSE